MTVTMTVPYTGTKSKAGDDGCEYRMDPETSLRIIKELVAQLDPVALRAVQHECLEALGEV